MRDEVGRRREEEEKQNGHNNICIKATPPIPPLSSTTCRYSKLRFTRRLLGLCRGR
jgi:hypothetical protein